MHLGQLTEQEKLTIQEQLMAEELCAKKVQMYLGQVQDPAIKGLLQQMADKGQRHVSTLNNMLQQQAPTQGGYTTMQ
jgi:demethoxyubiquinone hydroxylase (CLK1/Coq7/Cat5 family)